MTDTLTLIALAVALVSGLVLMAIYGHRLRWRDPRRFFTPKQRQALLARAGYQCEHKLPWWRRCPRTHRLEADHIRPWSKGGHTATWNGQILCRKHNQRKFTKWPSPIYQWRLLMRRHSRNRSSTPETQTPSWPWSSTHRRRV